MSFGSINNLLIINSFENELSAIKDGDFSCADFSDTVELLKSEFPRLEEKDIIRLLGLLIESHKCSTKESVELVVTAPPSFGLQTKLTENVVGDMLSGASKSIFISGYSVSDYIDDFIDLIINKSQKGVLVKLFINNVDKQNHLDKLMLYKGKFLKIYNYTNKNDTMSALHAKIISVDETKTLISSANLSYHGMSGNIEMGCYIESDRIALKLGEVFKKLLFQRVFTEL